MEPSEGLLAIATDLTSSLAAETRYERLLAAVGKIVRADAACLLARSGEELLVLAAHGLLPQVRGKRFVVREHPRLQAIAAASDPIRFPDDSPLADPFDGLLAKDTTALAHVHACLGCPLRVRGELVGVLAADALDPGAFDHLDAKTLHWISALAGAALETARLIDALERKSSQLGLVAEDLTRVARERRGELIGQSAAMRRVRGEIEMVAPTDLTVLITGETGTGKELVARGIHAASRRKDAALLYLNCAALPESVAESELFGHVKGAFTGAEQARAGKLEVADGGTLFLDEVGELPLSIQPKLLRALQEGEIQRVGADRTQKVDVRIIAATNRVLEVEVQAGKFRSDLFHRLNVFPLRVPPLSERREDIPLLAGRFADLARASLGLGPVRLSRAAEEEIAQRAWPGHVRELEHEISRAVLRAGVAVPRGEPVVVRPDHLSTDAPSSPAAPPPSTAPESAPQGSLHERVEAFQRDEIRRAVRSANGNWAAAARALGMHRSNLHHLAKRLGLERE